jgi:hypothetical protein
MKDHISDIISADGSPSNVVTHLLLNLSTITD